jgi:branched-chain amino acid transport system substrate-binding protein
MKHTIRFVALALCGVLGLSACNKEGGDASSSAGASEIVVGEFGSLTGSTATFGVSTKNGVDIAVDEINAGGGVLGKKVRVIVEDDQGKAEEAQTVVTKLIT